MNEQEAPSLGRGGGHKQEESLILRRNIIYWMGKSITVEEAAETVREKLDVDEEYFKEIYNMLLVKVYYNFFYRGYQQGFKGKEMISKPKFRFREHLPAKVYRKIRYIRKMEVINTLKFKLGLSTPQMNLLWKRISRDLKWAGIFGMNKGQVTQNMKSIWFCRGRSRKDF